jgi:phospholipase/carboxylesterase
MTAAGSRRGDTLWLELPPISMSAPRRLLVFLHGAGSSPEAFAPAAIAWQLKFPGATAAVVDGLRPAAAGAGKDWYDASGISSAHAERVAGAADETSRRIEALQQASGIGGDSTVLVGYSQGATVAIELARRAPRQASIVVAYAGRLARPVRDGESIAATIHLIHGELDSLVPVEQSQRSYRHLRAAGADVTLDIAIDEGHTIGQDMINLGTTRVLQTVFRGRRRAGGRTHHHFHHPETLQ